MKQKYDIKNGKCVFFLEGRVTQENAPSLEQELLEVLKLHPDCEFILDASRLGYISTSGLRVILKLIKESTKRFVIRNASDPVYSTLEQTGFTELAHVEKLLRQVSTDNCQVLGSGRSSTVYQLDAETIVKKYHKHVPLAKIRNEMGQARKAFVLGMPTPMAFDLVRTDDSYGVIFERIAPADTIGKTITEHPERFHELTRKYTDLLKQIHGTCIEKDDLPAARCIWAKWVKGMVPYYTEEEIGFLWEMVHGIPEQNTMVHCDFHENNVLVLGKELVLIDMVDIGYGHPIFDLAGGAFRAHVSLIPGRQAHHGLSAEKMQLFWKTVLQYYFETEDSEELNKIQDMCYAFGLVRSALFPMKHVHISDELRQLHINDARKNLFTRKDWALQQLGNLEQFFPVIQSQPSAGTD